MGLALWRVIRPDVTTTIRNSNDCPEDGDMQILYQRKCSKSVAIIRQCDVHWFLECKNCDSFGLPKKFHQVSTRSWISIFRLKEGSFPFATRLILNLELVWMTCRLPRPPYDPDLAPSNCHLFEPIKDEWRIHFPNNDDVITGVKKKRVASAGAESYVCKMQVLVHLWPMEGTMRRNNVALCNDVIVYFVSAGEMNRRHYFQCAPRTFVSIYTIQLELTQSRI